MKMSAGKRVMVFGSYAPSLINFRGPLISEIVERGHSVIAVAPGISSDVAAAIRNLGAAPQELHVTNQSLNPVAMIRAGTELRRLIRLHRPDVLISYTIKPVVLGAIAGAIERVPRIISLITGAGYAFTGGLEAKRLISRLFATLLYRVALNRSDRVVFQNRDDEELFRSAGLIRGDQNVSRINGSGVDTDYFAPVPLPSAASFLMIARLLKDKGIREFAAASARLKAEHAGVPIHLVGYLDGSPNCISEKELLQIRDSGVDFHGQLVDVRPAIADCSVYVLPSYREGTPRTVLEAMAMGRAIITTDAPGCRETVQDGVNGFLIPPRDSQALYNAMEKFVAEPALAARMGKESLRIAKSKYDVHRVNSDLMRIAEL